MIHNIGRNYSFNPVLSCNREYCNNGHIFLQRNLVYLQHNPLYPCIALVHHTATVQRPCSRPGFCSINEDIKTSFLCEHGIIPIPLPYYLQNFCLMIETESELSFPCHARTRNMDIFTFDKELELSIKMHSLIVLYQFIITYLVFLLFICKIMVDNLSNGSPAARTQNISQTKIIVAIYRLVWLSSAS